MRQQMEHINFWLLMLLAFCLPLSTSAISATACLILLCWLVEGKFREKFQEIVRSPMCLAVLVYLGVLLIGLCWAESLTDGMAAITKQWKILLLPIFLTTVRWQRRWWYVAAFIAGVTATMLVVSLDSANLLPVIEPSSQRISFHTETIQLLYTPMLAFVIYLVLHQFFWGGRTGLQRWCLLIFSGVLIIHLFFARGRTGHVAFFVLLAVLIFQYYRKNVLKAYGLVAVLFPIVFFAAYQLSPVFQGRMAEIPQNIQVYNKNPETSVGQRLQYWKISWEIIKQSPWIGVGTGDFSRAYIEMNNTISPGVSTTNNPHNQYIFATAQLGLLGLLSLLGLFVAHGYQAVRVRDGWERIRVAFPLFFMVIMCFESYLNLSGTGFLFSVMSAILCKNGPELPASAAGLHAKAISSREGQAGGKAETKGSATTPFLASTPCTAAPEA